MAIKLNQRETYFVSTALVAIIAFAVVELAVVPLLNKRSRLERVVQASQQQLRTMADLTAAFQRVQREAEFAKTSLAARKPGFSLFSFLDSLVGETGLKDRISYMKPSNSEGPDSRYKISSVEMKLQGITLEQLVQYLYKVEYSGKNVQVKRLSISQTGKEEGLVDVILQVETLEAA
jgi:general secretion pathway protein M